MGELQQLYYLPPPPLPPPPPPPPPPPTAPPPTPPLPSPHDERPPSASHQEPPPPRFDPSRMVGIIRRKALIKDLAAVYHAECLTYCQELLELQSKLEEGVSQLCWTNPHCELCRAAPGCTTKSPAGVEPWTTPLKEEDVNHPTPPGGAKFHNQCLIQIRKFQRIRRKKP